MARKPDLERKNELALAAFEALRAHGLVGATMGDVALALGMKRPTLYYWFSDLGELFDAVLTAILAKQQAYVLEHLNVDAPPIEVVASWLRTTLDFYEADPELISLLLQFWAVGRPDAAQRVLDRARDLLEPLRIQAIELLTLAVEEGLVLPCDPVGVLDLCVAVLDGCLVQRVARGADPRPTLERFIEFVLLPLRPQML